MRIIKPPILVLPLLLWSLNAPCGALSTIARFGETLITESTELAQYLHILRSKMLAKEIHDPIFLRFPLFTPDSLDSEAISSMLNFFGSKLKFCLESKDTLIWGDAIQGLNNGLELLLHSPIDKAMQGFRMLQKTTKTSGILDVDLKFAAIMLWQRIAFPVIKGEIPLTQESAEYLLELSLKIQNHWDIAAKVLKVPNLFRLSTQIIGTQLKTLGISQAAYLELVVSTMARDQIVLAQGLRELYSITIPAIRARNLKVLGDPALLNYADYVGVAMRGSEPTYQAFYTYAREIRNLLEALIHAPDLIITDAEKILRIAIRMGEFTIKAVGKTGELHFDESVFRQIMQPLLKRFPALISSSDELASAAEKNPVLSNLIQGLESL